MRRNGYIAVFVSCFILISGLLSPVSRAALLSRAPGPEQTGLNGTGLAPAMPPNMENSGAKTAFSSGGASADSEFREDSAAASGGALNSVLIMIALLSAAACANVASVRLKRGEVMLC